MHCCKKQKQKTKNCCPAFELWYANTATGDVFAKTTSNTVTGKMATEIGLDSSSVQFKMVSMRSGKTICVPPRLSEVFPTLDNKDHRY